MFFWGDFGEEQLRQERCYKLKEVICLHESKLNKTRAGVFSTKSKGLFKGMVLSPETQMSLCIKTWLFDGPHTDRATGENSSSWSLRELGSQAVCIGLGQGTEQWIIESGLHGSHGILLSGSMRLWLVGSFHLHGPGAETELKLRCYL